MSQYYLEQHDGISVLREDLIPGGSKSRFVPALVGGAREIVFGGPFCGGAPVALSEVGKRLGIPVTIFYAQRKELSIYQRKVLDNGAKIIQVPHGYMSNVQAKARRYAEEQGAKFVPLGLDLPEAQAPFLAFMRKLRSDIGDPDEIWCATGSGMLARCLGLGFPFSRVFGVRVGLDSRSSKQQFPRNVQLLPCKYDFAQACKFAVPFPSSPFYDSKAWEILKATRPDPGSSKILFWNVLY